VAGEIALEDAGCFARRLAFRYAARDVAARRGVLLAAMKDDGVQSAVELTVAAAAEAVPDRLAARGRQRGDAGEASEGGLGADAIAVRPADDQLGGDDRADTGLVEQFGYECANVADDLALEFVRFFGRGFDASSERAKRELVGCA
jgi:hypothetical protein